MNERYLSRGKRKDTGDWVQGFYSLMWGQLHITELADENTAHQVNPETVGQCTGLKDKNGKLIFEGDICKDSLGWEFKVEWDGKNVRFIGRHEKPRGDTYICYVDREPAVEIIGNVYDNPELL